MNKMFLVLHFLFALGGCGGGYVEVSEDKSFDAKTALRLLEQASTDTQKDHALVRIEKNTPQNFDWRYFWHGLEKRFVLSKWNKDFQDRVFALHAFSCQKDGFQAFGALAQKYDNGFPFLHAPLRSCSRPLSDATIGGILRKFDVEIATETEPNCLELKSIKLVKFLMVESVHNVDHNWKFSLDSVSSGTWEKVAKSLAQVEASNSRNKVSPNSAGSEGSLGGQSADPSEKPKVSLYVGLLQLHRRFNTKWIGIGL